MPDLPKLPVDARTLGPVFGPDRGKVFRPSMFVTLTLPSYGRVREDGSPVDPDRYDYRRAAWDAIHFPKLVGRLVENLRRVGGWDVQHFTAIEPQRRLSPHAHMATRGVLPRAMVRQVAAATFAQVWWPSTTTVVYGDDQPPRWDPERGGFCDRTTGAALPTWDEALDALDPDAEPEHLVRFGEQINIQTVLAGTAKADQLIGYLTKYSTKNVSQCHTITSAAQRRHQQRLQAELRYTPCTPQCPNWLRYGVQPKGARDGMVAGCCKKRVHQPDTLGLGGRRVLVSRKWSGKTLAEHRHDQSRHVRRVFELLAQLDTVIGDGSPPAGADTVPQSGNDPPPRTWRRVRPTDLPDYTRYLLAFIGARARERTAYQEARAALTERGISATAGGDR